jgi:hypothetical protein
VRVRVLLREILWRSFDFRLTHTQTHICVKRKIKVLLFSVCLYVCVTVVFWGTGDCDASGTETLKEGERRESKENTAERTKKKACITSLQSPLCCACVLYRRYYCCCCCLIKGVVVLSPSRRREVTKRLCFLVYCSSSELSLALSFCVPVATARAR